MKMMTTSEFKANFSSVVKELKKGNKVAITYGRSQTPLATVVPQSKFKKPDYSAKLGALEDAGWTYKLIDFEMTEEELLES